MSISILSLCTIIANTVTSSIFRIDQKSEWSQTYYIKWPQKTNSRPDYLRFAKLQKGAKDPYIVTIMKFNHFQLLAWILLVLVWTCGCFSADFEVHISERAYFICQAGDLMLECQQVISVIHLSVIHLTKFDLQIIICPMKSFMSRQKMRAGTCCWRGLWVLELEFMREC